MSSPQNRPRKACRAFALLCLFPASVLAQTKAQPAVPNETAAERRVSVSIEAARANPLHLHLLLQRLPKGADLHNHLSGAVYAESWIRAAAEDQLCVNLATLSFVKVQASTDNAPPHSDSLSLPGASRVPQTAGVCAGAARL